MRCVTVVGRTVIMVTDAVIMRTGWPDTTRHIAGHHFVIFKSSIELN